MTNRDNRLRLIDMVAKESFAFKIQYNRLCSSCLSNKAFGFDVNPDAFNIRFKELLRYLFLLRRYSYFGEYRYYF